MNSTTVQQFNVGDRVRIDGPAWTDNLGQTGTVAQTWSSDTRSRVQVAMDDPEAYPALEWKFAHHLSIAP